MLAALLADEAGVPAAPAHVTAGPSARRTAQVHRGDQSQCDPLSGERGSPPTTMGSPPACPRGWRRALPPLSSEFSPLSRARVTRPTLGETSSRGCGSRIMTSMERLVVTLKLRKGTQEQAAKLIAAGPPFDPGDLGIARHGVYLGNDLAI